jgi:lipopolysaccharide export system protein LptA
MKTHIPTMLFASAVFFSFPAQAERADRSKPVNLEADRVAVDERQQIQTFEGNVRLSQGSMSISTGKLIVRQDAEGFEKGTAFGGPSGNKADLGESAGLAKFRQKREGRNDFVEGEAERIEHDNRTEKTEFFGRARVRSGGDEVRGPYISYDGKTENYVVSGVGGSSAAKGDRVTATIQPKEKSKAEPTSKP